MRNNIGEESWSCEREDKIGEWWAIMIIEVMSQKW